MGVTSRWPVVILVALAAVFYFWHLSRPDIITDESSYAVRAIGLVDFDFGIEQPTPWQWISTPPPWWMRLSFHDHPPLVFLAQHHSIKFLGATPFAIRLPSVIAGLAAVWLVYLIGRRLYAPGAGLAGAALFAFTVNHVWISRIGLQESIAIAFMLASFYCFLRALHPSVSIDWPTDTDREAGRYRSHAGKAALWSAAAGLSLGLAFLAKYHALILIPIYGTLYGTRLLAERLGQNKKFLYLYDRNHIGTFWQQGIMALALFLAVASPVIIYNIQLYRNFGHFDFQFSLLLGQDVAAWQARPGQEVLGSYAERIQTFIPRLIEANSPYFLILSGLGLAFILQAIIRGRSRTERPLFTAHWFLLTALAWLLLFLVFIGPAHRFLTLLTPWLALAAGYTFAFIHSHILKNVRMLPVATMAVFATLLAVEGFYSYSSVIALAPIGQQPWGYSYLRRQAHSWGFNELNTYLDGELDGKMPDPAIAFEFPFAREILAHAQAEGIRQGLAPVPLGIVYNDNINLSSQLWVFLRRITYQGWPVVSAENFRSGGAANFLQTSGVKRILFINPTEHALQDRARPPTPDGDLMEAALKAKGRAPKEVKNPRGDVVFRVYQFDLP